MTTITASAPAVEPFAKATSAADERTKDSQRLARLTGLFFLLTYATSIPPVLTFYVPALRDPAFILGGSFDFGVSWGAILELLLIVTNIASALTLYPVLRKRFPVLGLGYVTARLTESAFIAFGIVAVLALNTCGRPLVTPIPPRSPWSARRSSPSMTGHSRWGRASSWASAMASSWAT